MIFLGQNIVAALFITTSNMGSWALGWWLVRIEMCYTYTENTPIQKAVQKK